MTKRLACLHAHYSNIDYIERALSPYEIEVIHFVDPGLMYLVSSAEKFIKSDAQNKVKDQLEWMAQCNVDAILITCTNYIAILQEDQLSIPVPIIKMDEPFIEYICAIQQPQTILFTNPATVEGTVARLKHYANRHQRELDFEVVVINNTFELIMHGRKEEYNQEIFKVLHQCLKDEKRVVSVAQLSMVEAAQQVEDMTAKPIINPLNTLISSIADQLELEVKTQ